LRLAQRRGSDSGLRGDDFFVDCSPDQYTDFQSVTNARKAGVRGGGKTGTGSGHEFVLYSKPRREWNAPGLALSTEDGRLMARPSLLAPIVIGARLSSSGWAGLFTGIPAAVDP